MNGKQASMITGYSRKELKQLRIFEAFVDDTPMAGNHVAKGGWDRKAVL
jgi:hypothetical protein